MAKQTVAFIGAGNLATSLIGGLIKDGFDPNAIWASDPHQSVVDDLQQRFAIHAERDNTQVAKQGDVIIFAVKPHKLALVIQEVAPVLCQQQPLVISVAAGVRARTVQKWLDDTIAIVRCMPNTPSLVGSGACGLYANEQVRPDQKNVAESIMRAVGSTVWFEDETQLDIVTALSASGPAYFFLVMEALEQAAIAEGLSAEHASLLTKQTALGAAHMALQSALDATVLRQQVTSPGGTTEQAIKILQEADIQATFAKALHAARLRAVELADLFDKQEQE